MIANDKDFGPIFICLLGLPGDEPYAAYHLESGLLYLWEGERMCIPDNPEAKMILLDDPSCARHAKILFKNIHSSVNVMNLDKDQGERGCMCGFVCKGRGKSKGMKWFIIMLLDTETRKRDRSLLHTKLDSKR